MTFVFRNPTARMPMYQGLSDQIASAVDRGDLQPGDRLPPQRELASRLGVTVTTVTRAYAHARRRGIVRGTAGSGTYVRDASRPVDAPVALDVNSLFPIPYIGEYFRLFEECSRDGNLELLDYQDALGVGRHRDAGAAWIGAHGLEVSGGSVAITAGAQHALLVAILSAKGRGSSVFCERLVYPGIRQIANSLDIPLVPVASDQEGLLPDALSAATRGKKGFVFVIPNGHNPTTATMPSARREAVASVVERRGLWILEDDVYGYLASNGRPPLSSFVPEQSFYVSSVSKSLVPGLRVGFLGFPEAQTHRVRAAMAATMHNAFALSPEVFARSIESGLVERILAWKRKELRERRALALKALRGFPVESHPSAPHIWLRLTRPLTGEAVAQRARERGVRVSAGESFQVAGDSGEHAVRVSLAGPRSLEELSRGLAVVRDILRGPASRLDVGI